MKLTIISSKDGSAHSMDVRPNAAGSIFAVMAGLLVAQEDVEMILKTTDAKLEKELLEVVKE